MLNSKTKYTLVVMFLFIILAGVLNAQSYKILSETQTSITIEVNFENAYRIIDTNYYGKKSIAIAANHPFFRKAGEPNLPEYHISVGIPFGCTPVLTVSKADKVFFTDKFVVPAPGERIENQSYNDNYFETSIYYANRSFPENSAELADNYIIRFARVQTIKVNPYQFNPITKELLFNKKVIMSIQFNQVINAGSTFSRFSDSFSEDFIKTSVINANTAKNWLGKFNTIQSNSPVAGDWYNASKDYFKIYLKEKNVYRLTYTELAAAGVPLSGGIKSNKLEMYGNGAKIPLDINDNGDSLFQPGDYITFIGYPPPASPYNRTTNIYNRSNVYWFSYQADTGGYYYKSKDGTPRDNYDLSVQSVLRTDHFEVDTIYENLGYARDGKRDHWFWSKITARDSMPDIQFATRFQTLYNLDTLIRYGTIRVNMHGITTTQSACNYVHSANIKINEKKVGNIKWNGQEEVTFDRPFYISGDSIPIYSDGNYINVHLDGKVCVTPKSDEARVNWIELEYWSLNRVTGPSHFFTSTANRYGAVRYWLWNWQTDTCVVYVPSKGIKIDRQQRLNNVDKEILFIDTVSKPTDYFMITRNEFKSVDSIIHQPPTVDLKAASSGADYMIIVHPKFRSIAQRLANFRKIQYPDSAVTNPRIAIVDINDIYNQFSEGLLNPYAIKDFVKHAFLNWTGAPVAYLTLIGDLSHDYRHIFNESRTNYIPSIPYHSEQYGEASSDNEFVCVVGEDAVPELALGRISIETIEEGNNFLDKIEAYPADPGKKWRERFMFMASGIDAEDESRYKFNEESLRLYNSFIELNGFDAKMIFRFPSDASQQKYKGSTREIIQGFDDGTIFANYYGHGGGYQWDLTFLNEDIYGLQNQGRLPLVSSVTCYTAHFDNQDVFGEQFVKVPKKGAIGFFGSSGLTYWQIGTYFSNVLLDEIANNKEYVSGRFFQKAKARSDFGGYYRDQISLLTYLGEPGLKLCLPSTVDFAIKSSDISISAENSLIGDSLNIRVRFDNYGIITQKNVRVDLYFQAGDSTGLIGTKLIPVFANRDSVDFPWIPKIGGLTVLTAKINLRDSLYEKDYSDNSAFISVPIFNLSDPAIIRPADGFSTDSSKVDILLADAGVYLQKSLEYYIEIDTSLLFSFPFYKSPRLLSIDGLVKLTTPVLPLGGYYWRSRIFDGITYGRWSEPRTILITDRKRQGYFLSGNLLKSMTNENFYYSTANQTLNLNTGLLPPKPMNVRIKYEIPLTNNPALDTIGLSCLASDGKYFYIADFWWDARKYEPSGKTKIHKVGTGNSGTVQGQSYGTIPGFFEQIKIQPTCHSDGYLYIPYNDPNHLYRINTATNLIDTIRINSGLFRYDDAKVDSGAFFLASDGNFVYNLAKKDTMGKTVYALRVFDPKQNWIVVNDYYFVNSSTYLSLAGFFVANGRFYVYEDYYSGFMKRTEISSGNYEGEWFTWTSTNLKDYKRFFAWCYDWQNDLIYTTVYRRGDTLAHKMAVFAGKYIDATGKIISADVGPAYKWNKINYDIQVPNTSSQYLVRLLGYNADSKNWDTLNANISNNTSIATLSTSQYKYLKLHIDMKDTSFSTILPISLKNVFIDYDPEFPEVLMKPYSLMFSPDSLLQGLYINMKLNVFNLSKNSADSCSVKFYLDKADTAFFVHTFSIKADSFYTVLKDINTSPIVLSHSIKAIASVPRFERVTSNNITTGQFFVARDSVKPTIAITFDGKEIINGDIISKKPEIKVALSDNSPLPINLSNFTLIFDNNPLDTAKLQTVYTPYPNSRFEINWKPDLKSGRHLFDVLAKDPSNNFFDTTYRRSIFYVYDENDMAKVYNYPNPFREDTYFTFELRGVDVPDEVSIHLFTINGRKIREMNIVPGKLGVGFNAIYWDGRDQDGDEIANGVYFYKIIAKFKDKTKITTEKFVKMK